jgi:hypothetical protein
MTGSEEGEMNTATRMRSKLLSTPARRRTLNGALRAGRERAPEDVTPEMMILGAALGILMVGLALYLV